MVGTASGGMYGYWTDGVTAPTEVSKKENVVTIGSGKDITGDLTVANEFTVSHLVPA